MLTNNEIRKQMGLGNIVVENMREDALNKPNSCDISIGNTLYTFDTDLPIDTRNKGKFLREVMLDRPADLKRVIIPENGFVLMPNKLYLTKTVERVKTHGYVPIMNGKTALSLLGVGIDLNSGYKTDNFNGHMLISLVATKPTIIYPDTKIGNLTFFKSLDAAADTRTINPDTKCGIYPTGMLSGEEIKARMSRENPDIIIKDPDKIVINPNSVNLTLSNEYGIYTDEVLDTRAKPNVKLLSLEDGGTIFKKGEIYLAKTNEYTETYNLVPMLSGRSSLGRNGLHVHCSGGMGSIGYRGFWHLGVKPISDISVVPDMKCCQIYYFTVDGEIENTYTGYMQDLPREELGSQAHKVFAKERNCRR